MASPARPPSPPSPKPLDLVALRQKFGEHFRPSRADIEAPGAVEAILSAFSKNSITFSRDDPDDQQLRCQAAQIGLLAVDLPDELRFQDPHSRELLHRLWKAAAALDEALTDVWVYGGMDQPLLRSERVNLCENFLSSEGEYEAVQSTLWSLSMAISTGLSRGAKTGGRGRQPLLIFYDFVRRMHVVFQAKTGKKGFHEKDGSARGPFVDVVYEAQSILPTAFQHADRRTIGNRIIEAFTEKIAPEII